MELDNNAAANNNHLQPETNSTPVTTQFAYNIQVSNKFGALMTNDNAASSSQKPDLLPATRKMPPIVLTTPIADFQKFQKEIKSLCQRQHSLRYLKKSINIITNCKEDFDAVKAEFTTNSLEFHTFTPKDDREKKDCS